MNAVSLPLSGSFQFSGNSAHLFGSHPQTFQQSHRLSTPTSKPKISIPISTGMSSFCDAFPCGLRFSLPTIASSNLCAIYREIGRISLATVDTAIGVLIADSNRMQAQLLTNALRRHPGFHITTCPMDTISMTLAVNAKLPRVALLSVVIQLPPRRRQFFVPSIFLTPASQTSYSPIRLTAISLSAPFALVRAVFFPSPIQTCDCFANAFSRVAAGQIWASTEQLNYLMDLISEVPSLRVMNSNGNRILTPREEQVVALVAEGLGNRQIARELNLSEHTIKKYLFRIFEKLGISSRVELVLYALNNGNPRPAEWIPSV